MSNAIATFLPLLVVAIVGRCMGYLGNNNATMHMQSTVPPNEECVAIYRDIDGMIALHRFVASSRRSALIGVPIHKALPVLNGSPFFVRSDQDQELLYSRARPLFSKAPFSEIMKWSSDEFIRRYLYLSAELNGRLEIHLAYPSRSKDELNGDANPDTTLPKDFRSRADSVAMLANCIYSDIRRGSLDQEMHDYSNHDALLRGPLLRSDLDDAFAHRIPVASSSRAQTNSDLNTDVDSDSTSSVELISSATGRQDRIGLADYLSEMAHQSGSSSTRVFQFTMTLTFLIEMTMSNDELRPVLNKLLERPPGDNTNFDSKCSICLEEFSSAFWRYLGVDKFSSALSRNLGRMAMDAVPPEHHVDMFRSTPPHLVVDDLTVSLECNHRFHIHCLLKWIGKRKAECPLCRNSMQL